MTAQNSPDDDWRASFGELKGIMLATFPQHATRIDTLDKRVDILDSRQIDQGNKISRIEGSRAQSGRLPHWVSIVATLAAVFTALTACAALIHSILT